jgi:uncharacterized protein YbjT (DUF2867 family)
MYVVLGGTGHIGSATAQALLTAGQAVTIVTRSEQKAEDWSRRGAQAAIVNVRDSDAVRRIFQHNKRAFLLNPLADPSTDTDKEERENVRCLLSALAGSGLEKVVAISTYGAHPGEACGDLTVLYELEEGLRRQCDIKDVTVLRSAYLMSNWDWSLDCAQTEGVLRSLIPKDLSFPMVSPADVGSEAARLLQEPPQQQFRILHIEGPKRYSPADVAAALAQVLKRDVSVDVTPRDCWEQWFQDIGFSEAAAQSYTRMTAELVAGPDLPESPIRGETSVQSYIRSHIPEPELF